MNFPAWATGHVGGASASAVQPTAPPPGSRRWPMRNSLSPRQATATSLPPKVLLSVDPHQDALHLSRLAHELRGPQRRRQLALERARFHRSRGAGRREHEVELQLAGSERLHVGGIARIALERRDRE